MAKIQLVEFKNGKHGVMRKHWFWGISYLSMRGTGNWYEDPLSVAEYCQSSKATAERFYLNSKPIKYTVLK